MDFHKVEEVLNSGNIHDAQLMLTEFDENDPKRRILLSEIALLKGDYSFAEHQANLALQIAVDLKDFKLEGRAREKKSLALWWLGKISDAEMFITETENRIVLFQDENQQLATIWNGFLNNLKGLIYWSKGELDISLEFMMKSLEFANQLKRPIYSSYCNFIIGIIYHSFGKLDTALDYMLQSLEASYESKSILHQIIAINGMGVVYHTKGEYELALDYFNQSLEIHSTLNNPQYLAYSFDYIGLTYQHLGEADLAEQYFKNSLEHRYYVGNNIETSFTLYNLVINSVEKKDLTKARFYLEKLHEVAVHSSSRVAILRDKMAQGLILKHKYRAAEKVQAQQIFESIVNSELVNFELTVFAMINLVELLLWELQSSGGVEILEQIDDLLNHLSNISETQNLAVLQIETKILQSKLFQIKQEIDMAINLLENALRIAKDNTLGKYEIKIQNQLNSIGDQLSSMQTVLNDHSDLVERLHKTDILEYMESIHKLINFKTISPADLKLWPRNID